VTVECPKCHVIGNGTGKEDKGLMLVSAGGNDGGDNYPVQVMCLSCGAEGPIRTIQNYNRTKAPWEAFFRIYGEKVKPIGKWGIV
jgi:hypothetical protein